MGKSLREVTDERLGEGAYERLLTEAIEENRYSFSPNVGWVNRKRFAMSLPFELCQVDGVPDIRSIAEDMIVDSWCEPDGHLDLACEQAASTFCDKLRAAGIEGGLGEDVLLGDLWPDIVFEVRDHDLVYSTGFFDMDAIYDELSSAELEIDLCLGDYSYTDVPTGRFSELVFAGDFAGAVAWAHDPENREDMERNPIVMLLASQGRTVDDLCDPEAHTPFLDSLRDEIANTTYPDTCVVAFLLKVPVADLAEGWSEQRAVTVLDGDGQVECGLFSPQDGSGGPFGIALDKPVKISLSETPSMILYEDAGEGVNGYYTVDEAYGLVDDAWRHGTLVTSATGAVTPDRAAEALDAARKDPDLDRLLSGSGEFRYMMLDRLRSDCDYVLAHGGAEKHLWAGNVEGQVRAMEALWDSFPEDGKPEWLSREEIGDYARRLGAAQGTTGRSPADVAASARQAAAGASGDVRAQDPARHI